MKVEVNDKGGAVVVGLAGEIDLQHSPKLRKLLMDLMLDKRNVVMDLSAVAYIDSSGIASLVEAYQMARKNRNQFTLASVSQAVMRVLLLARLDKVFAIADTVEAALETSS